MQVHIFGHSLGSVLSYDILCHQPKPFLAELHARLQASAGGPKPPSRGDGGLKGIPENMQGESSAVEKRVSGVEHRVSGGNTIGGEEEERDPGRGPESGTEVETSGGEAASERGAEREDERSGVSEPAAESSGDSKEGIAECSRGGEDIRGAIAGESVGEGVQKPEDECLGGGFSEQKSIVDDVMEGAVGGNPVVGDVGTAGQSHSGTGEMGYGEQGGAALSGEATPGTGADASESSRRFEGFSAEFSERPGGEGTSTVIDNPDSGKGANGGHRDRVTGDVEVTKLREEVAQLKEKLRMLEGLAGHSSVQGLDAVGGRPMVVERQLSLEDRLEEISSDRKGSENGRESVEDSEHDVTGGSTSTGSAMKIRHGQAEVDSGDVSKASGDTSGEPSPDPQSNPDASDVNKPQPADTNSPHSDPPQPAHVNYPQPEAEAPHSASVNTAPAAVHTKFPLMSSPSIDISAADLKGGAINPEVLRKRGPHAFIHYPRLAFEVDTFFAVGSPLGMFLALRNIEFGSATRGENMDLQRLEQSMPAARHMMNIFHPYDPVAYRYVIGDCLPQSISRIVSHM
jgi:hypothetical protein